MMKYCILVIAILIGSCVTAQRASIRTDYHKIKTYPFSDPDPIPVLTQNAAIYPYHKFNGYSHTAIDSNWQVVRLENDHIKVFILPQVGGKVWGAIDKTTGNEFIYRNEVLKFRNISMRGPWTSGGIEFNFGVIGHHPSTATPVDYKIENHEDGSVSCTVGNIDLPSRTHWRVKIILPADKAYFITEASWYNPTSFSQAYYNWMTAAAFAQKDLKIYVPGDQYLDHGGDVHPYPLDSQGSDLSKYRENNFGPSKSYHVVGSYEKYFGGYFEEDDYGFGHWATYDDSPGQKMWLWALSRAGGIWEDLLTDTDGQYIEFQAGRMLNQYSPSSSKINPISKASFSPGGSDNWREIWFPVSGIGGISDASDKGVLHVEENDGMLQIGVNSFSNQRIHLNIDGKTEHSEEIKALAMKPILRTFPSSESDIQVSIPELDVKWSNQKTSKKIVRNFNSELSEEQIAASNEYQYFLGKQAYVSRNYDQAEILYQQCIKNDPLHLRALASLAELYAREAKYEKSSSLLRKALAIDSYDPYANFVAATVYRQQKDYVNALEAYSWAVRSLKFRSVGYTAMAEICLAQNNHQTAMDYARKGIQSGDGNVQALLAHAIALRKSGIIKQAIKQLNDILELDPLHHAAIFEKYLLAKREVTKEEFNQSHRSEFAYQTVLELMLYYIQIGDIELAKKVVDLYSGQELMVNLWRAFLNSDVNSLDSIANEPVDFVFPYRIESLKALDWACQSHESWKFKYLASLNMLALRKPKGKELLKELGKEPDSEIFYLHRAKVASNDSLYNPEADLLIANSLSDDWRIDHELFSYYHYKREYKTGLSYAKEGLQLSPSNYVLQIDAIKSYLHRKEYDSAISEIDKTNVLPFEGASEGRLLYELAYCGKALQLIMEKEYSEALMFLEKARLWKESMGVGKPYDYDERLIWYLESICFEKVKRKTDAENRRAKISRYTINHLKSNKVTSLLGMEVLKLEKMTGIFADMKEMHKGQEWILYLENLEIEYKSDDLLINFVIGVLDFTREQLNH